MARMTEEEFDEQCESLQWGFDTQLFAVLKSIAYDRGHHAGREEVLSILENLTVQFSELNSRILCLEIAANSSSTTCVV